MLTIYGIKNCNTMQKTFDWLNEKGVQYVFHDYKKQGIDADSLKRWFEKAGKDALINRQGLTWKKLSDTEKKQADNAASAIELLMKNTSMIKRPVIEGDGVFLLGFDPEKMTSIA